MQVVKRHIKMYQFKNKLVQATMVQNKTVITKVTMYQLMLESVD